MRVAGSESWTFRHGIAQLPHAAVYVRDATGLEPAPDSVVVHDIPLLVEAGMAGGYDVVVVVETPRALRLERLERRGLPRDQAEARMASQATDEARRAVADVVLDNSGTLVDLHAHVDALWADLVARQAASG